MLLRRLGLLISVLVLAFGVVACGDDEESPADSGSTTTETTTTEDSGDSEDSGGDLGDLSDEEIAAGVEQCKSTIEAQTQLSDDVKSDLNEICDKLADGDLEDAQAASVEICKKIAEDTVPEGDARDQVIAACDSAAP